MITRMTTSNLKPLTKGQLEQVIGGAHIDGTPDADTIFGTWNADRIWSGEGNDVVESGPGDDMMYVGAGDDVVSAGSGHDIVYGGDGNDTINGGSSNFGTGRDDLLAGTVGDQDELYGDAGDDVLDGGAHDRSADNAYGGADNDTYIWAPGGGNDHFDGGTGSDTLRLHGVSLSDLQAGLALTEGQPNLQMKVSGNIVSFTDESGNPATFSGTFRYGSETVSFSNIEQIKLG